MQWIFFPAAGIGVSIVPASMQQVHTQGVAYRPLRGNPLRAVLSLASRRGEIAEPVRNFIALVRAAARQKAGDLSHPSASHIAAPCGSATERG